jgi:hypothetical protein
VPIVLILLTHFTRLNSEEWVKENNILGRIATTIIIPQHVQSGLARSLEMKWGIIKHDLSKFAGCYGVIQGLCEFGISVGNIL